MITSKQILIALACLRHGDWEKIYDNLKAKTNISAEAVETYKWLEPSTCTLVDEDYPKRLRDNPKPPFVLFFNHEHVSLDGRKFAYIARGRSEYEKRAEAPLTAHLIKQGYTVLTLDSKKACINAVSQDGSFDISTRRFDDEEGYTPQSLIDLIRIASTMSERNYILSAKTKGQHGYISTAFALNAGNDVYALPHPFDEDDFCNDFISEGANVITRTELGM